nr:MAG TPA: hypothetical protein [Caudoviricetes sp.]DAX76403.1 MAG TPA: hypothetical protein [Bacteriophage sp.]
MKDKIISANKIFFILNYRIGIILLNKRLYNSMKFA